MKQLLIILAAGLISCASAQSEKEKVTAEVDHSRMDHPVKADTTKKWKADEATKRNVAAIAKIVDDEAYKDPGKNTQLVSDLQSAIDTLVKECRMKGPDHDALHGWLEEVIEDMKEIKTGEEDYHEAFAGLKKDVMAFYKSFE